MKQTVTLLHGWGYTSSIWQGLAARLPEYAVATPSVRSEHDTLDALSDELTEAMPDHGIVGGWSLGALVALNIAARHPHKIDALLLIGASPRMVNADGWTHGLDATVFESFQTSFATVPARTAKRFLALQLLGDRQGSDLQTLLESSLEDPFAHHEVLQHGLKILANADLRHAHIRPDLPTHIVHGRHDALMPVQAAEWLHQRFDHSALTILEDAAHAPLLNAPDTLAAIIRTLDAAHA